MKHWKVKPFKKINNIDLFEYLNYRYDGYGNLIDHSFWGFFKRKIVLRDGDIVEYKTNEYNPKKRKVEQIILVENWKDERVFFPDKKTTVFTSHWLKLISREYKIGKFIIKKM